MSGHTQNESDRLNTTTMTVMYRLVLTEFFLDLFHLCVILQNREGTLQPIWQITFQLKDERSIVLLEAILKILPYCCCIWGIYDTRSNFFWNGIHEPWCNNVVVTKLGTMQRIFRIMWRKVSINKSEFVSSTKSHEHWSFPWVPILQCERIRESNRDYQHYWWCKDHMDHPWQKAQMVEELQRWKK